MQDFTTITWEPEREKPLLAGKLGFENVGVDKFGNHVIGDEVILEPAPAQIKRVQQHAANKIATQERKKRPRRWIPIFIIFLSIYQIIVFVAMMTTIQQPFVSFYQNPLGGPDPNVLITFASSFSELNKTKQNKTKNSLMLFYFSLSSYQASYGVRIRDYLEIWRLFTGLFIHQSIGHIILDLVREMK